jgi:pimeloyl-ACP methyl ester carboxylesterase
MKRTSTARLNAKVASRLADVVDEMDLADAPPEVPYAGSASRRRGFAPSDYNGLASLSLVDDEGTLRWIYRPPGRAPAARRARRAAMAARVRDNVVHEFSFKETPPNNVIGALEALDKKLNDYLKAANGEHGLRRLKGGKLEPAPNVVEKGRVLLLVHGTFSKSDMYVDELNATAEGRAFLGKAVKKYDEILLFDHPTLSVSPWINALDLELALQGVTGPIDVVCHSRGGLVVAWWLRNAKRQVENVVFVGAPLEGTSLASPAKLRAALQGLANVFKGLETASAVTSTVLPFMTVVTGLAKIFGGIIQLGASTPLADAAVVIVPGLASQSLAMNNAELDRLSRKAWISTPNFYAVTSNFEPGANDEWWQVWKLLRKPKEKLLDWGADAIFDGENDLVVDTGSMIRLFHTDLPSSQLCPFGTSTEVHHCNYFRQAKTVAFLSKVLQV